MTSRPQEQLVLVVMGKAPSPLTQFVRTIVDRMEAAGVPEAEIDQVDQWIWTAAHLDLDVRWGDVYNFWVLAQLPEFVMYLHFLEGLDPAALGEAQWATLREAFKCWPVPVPPPPPRPEGIDDEEWAAFVAVWQHRAFQMQELQAYFDRWEGLPVNSRGVAMLWVALYELLERWKEEDRRFAAILGEAPKMV